MSEIASATSNGKTNEKDSAEWRARADEVAAKVWPILGEWSFEQFDIIWLWNARLKWPPDGFPILGNPPPSSSVNNFSSVWYTHHSTLVVSWLISYSPRREYFNSSTIWHTKDHFTTQSSLKQVPPQKCRLPIGKREKTANLIFESTSVLNI